MTIPEIILTETAVIPPKQAALPQRQPLIRKIYNTLSPSLFYRKYPILWRKICPSCEYV